VRYGYPQRGRCRRTVYPKNRLDKDKTLGYVLSLNNVFVKKTGPAGFFNLTITAKGDDSNALHQHQTGS
jgi:hypothetical protein